MKIAFLSSILDYGGAERQLVMLADGLRQRGHSVVVLTYRPGGKLEKDLIESGISLRWVDKKGRWDIFSFVFRLIKIVREESPDILHSYLRMPNIFAVMMKYFLPHTHIVWGIRASAADLTKYGRIAILSYRIECYLSRFADLIISNSHSGLAYAAANGFPEGKMIVIHNGIDTVRFQRDVEARRRLRSEWRVAENEKLIGIVGRLDPMKDHKNFFKAASLLTRERNDVRFVCIGDGPAPYHRELRQYSNELGLSEFVIWESARSDIPCVYNALDIIVSSSLFGEGFPNVIGEAMACCTPSVVTRIGDSNIIVGEDENVVPPGNSEALKNTMERLLEKISINGYRGECNRQRIVQNFSVDDMLNKTESALLRLSRRSETI